MYRAKLGKLPFARFVRTLDEGHDRMLLAEELGRPSTPGSWSSTINHRLDLRTRQVQAVEALLRWIHPRLGLLPPEQFLPWPRRPVS